jgi:hypothetical protein
MKAHEEILQILKFLHKQVKKDTSIKKKTSARQVTTSISHRKSDDHGNERQQEACEGSIILQSSPLEELMKFYGHGAAQV